MMKLILALLTIAPFAAVGAEVFRTTGPDGEVYFSDRPTAAAVRVELSPAQTVDLRTRAPTEDSSVDQQPADVPYAELSVVKPSFDQGVRANGGSVTVYLSLQPALQAGHIIELTVDGEDGERIYSGDTLNFNLNDMSRGRHTVAVRVVNEKGQELIRTGPVGFYVLRVALGGRRGR